LSLASVEFGVEEYHVPLVVVLGHSRCGAVEATVDALQSGDSHAAANPIVEAIRPAYESVKAQSGDLVENAVLATCV
jgi:carbonic anhydrase